MKTETLAAYKTIERAILSVTPFGGELGLIFTKTTAKKTGLPIDVVKAIYRDLRNRGLVRLSIAYNEDECTVHGSGWCITRAGREELAA